MKRVVLSCLAAGLLVGCQGDSDSGDLQDLLFDPSFMISDGQTGGNPDFFWLPPLVPNPSGDPNFQPAEFNPDLFPVVQICEGTGTDGTECDSGPEIALFTTTSGPGGETVTVNGDHYHVNWHTDDFDLDPSLTYRIRVLVGSIELGFADVDVVSSGKELKNVNTNEYIALKDGRTLPIKFAIENAALCNPPGVLPCASKSVDLTESSTVVLAAADDSEVLSTVEIPGQNETSGTTTITMEPCEAGFGDLPVDIPLFGGCFTITADPPLSEGGLDVPATVSVCGLEGNTGLPHEQEELVTLLRYDGGTVQALPHAQENCSTTLGRATQNPLLRLARAGWETVRNLVGPEPLVAGTALIDRGGGGRTPLFSQFQFGLPAKMEVLPGVPEEQIALIGGSVPELPAVLVTDARGGEVAFATVNIEAVDSRGSVTPMVVVTGADGIAEVASWLLGSDPGEYQVRFSGRGIADPVTNGPLVPDFDPFWSDFAMAPPGGEGPVTLLEGELVFTATATEYAIEQDGIETPVLALERNQDVGSFYSYSSPIGASSNTQVALGTGNGLETSDTSILFLYDDQAGNVSLVMIHDKPDDSGGKAVFTFSDYTAGTGFILRDDGGGSEAVLPVSTWRWDDCCTDGGILGPVNSGFSVTIAPDFVIDDGTLPPPGLSPGQIDFWQFISGTFADRNVISLDMNAPLIIRRVSTP